ARKQNQAKGRTGFVFGLFLALLFSSRFFLEFFKIDQVGFEAGMSLNMGQWLSLPFVLIGVGFMIYSYYSRTPQLSDPTDD
ncbi:MAG: phosphatidylglycerol:prolipoprotein diacylglycerol transferase, partial [Patescibacteria group bacterium]